MGRIVRLTREDPGRLVDQDDAQTFRVVGFEALDHEFDLGVVLQSVRIEATRQGHSRKLTIFDNPKSVISKTSACSLLITVVP